jgi:hypothetical protein
MGGPFGAGTLIITASNGFILQRVFDVMKYEPNNQKHLSFNDLIPATKK